MAEASRVGDGLAKRQYARFTVLRRVEHLLLLLSFTALAITGLPQKFVGAAWAETMIAWMGGIENVRQFHHISAIVLLVVSALEFLIVGYKIYVERARWTIMPDIKDVVDAWDHFRFNLRLRRHAPQYDRYSWMEKFEYWALVWGTAIMAITGFILWNPVLSTTFLPGELIPAAKAAHGGEAILAVLAVIVWHGYHVHLKRLNLSMFTGKLSADEMQEEHALELERVKRGEPEIQDRGMARRRRLYLPFAGAFAVVLLLGIYFFTTMETTALATVPRESTTRQAFVPRTFTPTASRIPTHTPIAPTATPGASPTSGAPIAGTELTIPFLPISHEGRTTCSACHASGFDGAPLNPPDHEGREDTTCATCHVLEPVGGIDPGNIESSIPPAMPISHEGRTTCFACHASGFDGAPLNPPDHEGREDTTCTTCHVLEAVGGIDSGNVGNSIPFTPTPTSTVSAAEGETGAQPSPSTNTNQCIACHPFDRLLSLAPMFEVDGDKINPHIYVPHDSEDILECTTCHVPHTLSPLSEGPEDMDLSGVNVDACFSCHHLQNFTPCQECH